jgi:prepilin-type N-terminal cleavage/methylation domain-containing protein
VIRRNFGFTLLEVIIAMMIMAFMSLFTVQAIQQALKTKTKVQREIDKSATLRDALRIMERDINMAFNYRDSSIELYNQAQLERRKRMKTPQNQQPAKDANGNPITPPGGSSGGPPGTNSPQLSEEQINERTKLKVEKIYTQFIGEPTSLDFTTLSNVRMTEDSQVSSQAEIGYHLKSCRRRSTQGQSSQCLWRRVSNVIHDDITKSGEETVLLENVSDFKLRYLGVGHEEEWLDSWITTERGTEQSKGNFPYAVEVTIAVKDQDTKDKELRMTMVAAIRNPNNKKKEQPGLNPDGTPMTPEQQRSQEQQKSPANDGPDGGAG